MAELLPEDRISGFFQRTMTNLCFVRENAKEDGPYEATQLVCSFLGAILAWENLARDQKTLVRKVIREMEMTSNGTWALLDRDADSTSTPSDHFQELEWIRHGFAHGRISFVNKSGKIVGLHVRNEWGTTNWGSELTLDQLDELLKKYFEIADCVERKASAANPSANK